MYISSAQNISKKENTTFEYCLAKGYQFPSVIVFVVIYHVFHMFTFSVFRCNKAAKKKIIFSSFPLHYWIIRNEK